jgi:ubiquinone/menaquinone biosynthesis C-methylase UbiE
VDRHATSRIGMAAEWTASTPELIETGQILTERCGLSGRVVLQIGDALDLPYPDKAFDVIWCQNVTMNISDKARFLAEVYRMLTPGGLFTSTEFSIGPGGDILYPLLGLMTPQPISSLPKTL